MELIPTVGGGLIAAGAAVVAGMTGFGYALLCTPLLLALGYPPAVIVAANLSIVLLTRLAVAWQLRSWVSWRRVGSLVAGSLPGLALGARLQAVLDPETMRLVIGLAVVVVAAVMLRQPPPALGLSPSESVGTRLATGLAGGVLGTTTSLSGVPPAFYLSRLGLDPVRFIADLAVYFVLTNAAGLLLLACSQAIAPSALVATTAVWLPGALLGTALGVRLSLLLPALHFRTLVLSAAFGAGLLAVVTVLLP